MKLERMKDWNIDFLPTAVEELGEEALTPLWRNAYLWQVVFSEMALSNLNVDRTVKPDLIPDEGTILNCKPLEKREIGLINVIGMPGAGKDTMITRYGQLNRGSVTCAPEEGYFWSREFDPNMTTLRQRHLRAYGGMEMEVDEMLDKLNVICTNDGGIGIMNRSIEDNFLAFAYSFFLAGFMGLADLIISQRLYHYFQYSPTLKLRETMTSVDDLTMATIILMVEPEISLKRKGRSGRIMNDRFLRLLYSQYLRMISRLRDDSTRNLVVLDMSGSEADCFEKFRMTVDAIVG